MDTVIQKIFMDSYANTILKDSLNHMNHPISYTKAIEIYAILIQSVHYSLDFIQYEFQMFKFISQKDEKKK